MEPVPLAVREERNMRIGFWIKPVVGIEVNDLRRPDVPSLFYDIHIVIDEEPQLVRIRLVRLHVARAECRIAAVDGREQDYLRGREALDEVRNRDIYSTAERLSVTRERAFS